MNHRVSTVASGFFSKLLGHSPHGASERVGARYVTHFKKIAFGIKIANAQHRLGQPGFNPSDLHRECRDCKGLGLTGAVLNGCNLTILSPRRTSVPSARSAAVLLLHNHPQELEAHFVERLAGSCCFAIYQPGPDIQQPAT